MPSKNQIQVGNVPIGGGAPVAVQTMTKTETADIEATLAQIKRVAEAGADLVRCAVPREKDAEALKTLVRESPIPIIADIHFNYTLALKAFDAGAHCIRINPGNIGGPDKVAEGVAKAKELNRPMRIKSNPAKTGSALIWANVTARANFFFAFTVTTAIFGSSSFASACGSDTTSAIPIAARTSPV